MLFNITFFPLVLILNCVALLSLGIYLFNRKGAKGARYLAYAMFFTSLWSIAGANEISVFGAEAKILAGKISYLGIVFAGPMWLLFTLEFAQIQEKYIRVVRSILVFAALIIFAFVVTNEFHNQLWITTVQQGSSGFSPILYTHGPLFFINLILQYATLTVGVVVIIVYGIGQQGREKRQIMASLVAVIIPWIANIYYLYTDGARSGYDLTPFAFLMTGTVLTLSFFGNRYYELRSIAKEKVLDSISSGIVITNGDGAVIELNRSAREMLGSSIKIGTKIKGRGIFVSTTDTAEAYLDNVKKWIEIEETLVVDPKNAAKGSIYYLHDITKKRAEYEKIQQSENLFSSIINFLPDAVFVIDAEGKVIIWNKAMEKLSGVSGSAMLGKAEQAYAVPFYGKKRPMLVDVVLTDSVSRSQYYKGIDLNRVGDTVRAVIEGEGKVMECTAKPLLNMYGKRIGAVELIRDITEQRLSEKSLIDRVDTLAQINEIMVKREARMNALNEKLKALEKKK